MCQAFRPFAIANVEAQLALMNFHVSLPDRHSTSVSLGTKPLLTLTCMLVDFEFTLFLID